MFLIEKIEKLEEELYMLKREACNKANHLFSEEDLENSIDELEFSVIKIDSSVWKIKNGKAQSCTVIGYRITEAIDTKIEYFVRYNSGGKDWISEKTIFRTMEECAMSLFQE